jgi:hypothetical protein
VLVVVIAIATGIRLIFSLLTPVWPYLAAVLVAVTVIRLLRWYRGRW